MHLSNVHFVLRDISAVLALLGAHDCPLSSLSVEAIERKGGGRRHGREA